MNTRVNLKSIEILTLITLTIFFLTYVKFLTYQPKNLLEIQEVKGTSTELQDLSVTIPTPPDAMQVATNDSSNLKHITFKTEKTTQEVLNFYKNILSNDKWRLKSEGTNGAFSTAHYVKGSNHFYISASHEESDNTTVVSVEFILSN